MIICTVLGELQVPVIPTNAECFISQPATLYENGFSAGGQNETCATYNMLKLTSDLFLFDQRAELMDYYERGVV